MSDTTNNKPQPLVRDLLALDRTHLANERTALSFMRTALYMVVTGFAIINFYPDKLSSHYTAYALFALGLVIFFLGIFRYFQMKAKILDHYKE